jgi:hypothetical protein
MSPVTVTADSLKLLRGRACVSDEELDLIARTVAGAGDGHHLEIGSMWGGTAIAAARAKKDAGHSGKIICVDSFIGSDGEWGTASPQVFWQNIEAAKVRERVELHVCPSDPWPFRARVKFVSALIDGDHGAPWPQTDWDNVSRVCPLILVHDVGRDQACTDLHNRLLDDPDWRVLEYAQPWMYLYGRVA